MAHGFLFGHTGFQWHFKCRSSSSRRQSVALGCMHAQMNWCPSWLVVLVSIYAIIHHVWLAIHQPASHFQFRGPQIKATGQIDPKLGIASLPLLLHHDDEHSKPLPPPHRQRQRPSELSMSCSGGWWCPRLGHRLISASEELADPQDVVQAWHFLGRGRQTLEPLQVNEPAHIHG